MTWQLFSSDLPFLNEITVFQVKTKGEVALSYAPLGTASFALISMIITIYIAAKARKISSEQKRIAQDKLDLDLLDKRYNVVRSYIDFFKYLVNCPQDKDDIITQKIKFEQNYLYFDIFFPEKYKNLFVDSREILRVLAKHRVDAIGNQYYNSDHFDELENSISKTYNYLTEMRILLKEYSPNFIRYPPTSSPASLDKPQPTAPAVDQSPPTP
ncbi:hypothetical protein [Acetobacter sp. LMG 32666]|uniref:hypothetical protein n=1 Tax=Acetobacter sp. LMG 32666 TaxID=2959295 RepID=UPI0030C89A6F